MTTKIAFNVPSIGDQERLYLQQALEIGHLSGDGPFTHKCHAWLEANTGCAKALLTHSCTAALELAALLLDINPGDEIIMPSYTFVSTANAFVLRGAIPVFVDIRPDTFNIDEALIEAAITSKTRAIVVVHYAGIGCEMDAINEIATQHGLKVVEDAAQGAQARYRGRPLGTLSSLATFSFHETKNIVSGEGGALLVNDEAYAIRAEIMREKGTDRSRFLRGDVDKYTWQDIGSSFLPSELLAALLFAQLERAAEITATRLQRWNDYHRMLEPLEHDGQFRRPVVPEHCEHNGHIYHLLFENQQRRAEAASALGEHGIRAVTHYVPLHSSPAGERFGRTSGSLPVTDHVAASLLRLPMHTSLTPDAALRVRDALRTLAS